MVGLNINLHTNSLFCHCFFSPKSVRFGPQHFANAFAARIGWFFSCQERMAFGKRRQGRAALALVAVIAGTWTASTFVLGVWAPRPQRDVTTKALAGIDVKLPNPALADAKARMVLDSTR
eukprot:s58_g21.t1